MERLKDEVRAELHFQPFELNPAMPQGGQDITEHLTQKYGRTLEQQAAVRDAIRDRGAEVGFEFRKEGRDRIYNTFNAHRLLHWAGTLGCPIASTRSRRRCSRPPCSDSRSPAQAEVLIDAAAR